MGMLQPSDQFEKCQFPRILAARAEGVHGRVIDEKPGAMLKVGFMQILHIAMARRNDIAIPEVKPRFRT